MIGPEPHVGLEILEAGREHPADTYHTVCGARQFSTCIGPEGRRRNSIHTIELLLIA